MSMPSLTNNIIQSPQNIVINQLPVGGAKNGVSMVNNVNQQPSSSASASAMDQEMKTSMMMDTSASLPSSSTMVNMQVAAPTTPTASVQQNATSSPVKSMHSSASNSNNANASAASAPSDPLQVLSKTRMADLIRDIDPNINMDEEVEEVLLGYVDDFVDRVLNGASIIAKHRHGKNIEVKDVQMFINRNYNMWAPGLGTDELRPYKRSLTTESHKQRLALIRKALKKY